MSIEFKNPAEAIAAIASAVIAADQTGSITERDRFFQEAKKLPVYKGYETAQFTQLLGKMAQKVYDTYPSKDGVLAEQGFKNLVATAKKLLDVDLQRSTFELMVSVTAVNGVEEAEEVFLDDIRKGFNLDPQFVKHVRKSYGLNDNPTAWKKAA